MVWAESIEAEFSFAETLFFFKFYSFFIPTTTTSELLLGGIKVAEKTNY